MNDGFDRYELITDQVINFMLEMSIFITVVIGVLLLLLLLKNQLDGFDSKKPDYSDKEMLSIVKSAEERIFGNTAQSADDWLREERENVSIKTALRDKKSGFFFGKIVVTLAC